MSKGTAEISQQDENVATKPNLEPKKREISMRSGMKPGDLPLAVLMVRSDPSSSATQDSQQPQQKKINWKFFPPGSHFFVGILEAVAKNVPALDIFLFLLDLDFSLMLSNFLNSKINQR